MRELVLTHAGPSTVLCLGAHPDDIEIGCGGTLLKMRGDHGEVRIHWAVFSSEGRRKEEAEASARRFLGHHDAGVRIDAFPDGFFPWSGTKIKESFRELARNLDPDVIFTHTRDDLHQDHRLIHELTWQTFRDHMILEYEIPKFDGDLGHPNCFVPLSRAACDQKIRALLEGFPTQRSKPWFSEDTFRALLRLRGVECRSPTGFAEAFHCRKLVLG